MARYQVVIKQVISPDAKTIAEARSVVITSGEQQTEITQTVSVEVSAGYSSSRSYSKSTSHAYSDPN